MKAYLYTRTLIWKDLSVPGIPARFPASGVTVTNLYWLCLSSFQRWLIKILFLCYFVFILILLEYPFCERLAASCDQGLTAYFFWSQLFCSHLVGLIFERSFEEAAFPTKSHSQLSTWVLISALFSLMTHRTLIGWCLNFKACYPSLLSLSFGLFFLCQ